MLLIIQIMSNLFMKKIYNIKENVLIVEYILQHTRIFKQL